MNKFLPIFAIFLANAYADQPESSYPVNYQYAYEVKDDYASLNFGQEEAREGYATNGQYQVLLPDGRTQTVTYNVGDAYTGYVADVHYSGEAKEPAYNPPKPAYNPPRPAYNPPKPAYNPPKPAYNLAQPVYNQPKPAYVPAYAPAKPAYVPAKPAYVPAKPAYVQPKPTYVQPKPAYAPVKPVYAQTKPTAKPVYVQTTTPAYKPKPTTTPAYKPKPTTTPAYEPKPTTAYELSGKEATFGPVFREHFDKALFRKSYRVW